jgi:hypothetical protein
MRRVGCDCRRAMHPRGVGTSRPAKAERSYVNRRPLDGLAGYYFEVRVMPIRALVHGPASAVY